MSEINIYYSRHCITQQNILKELKFLDKSKYISIEYSSLSNFGILHALQIYDKYNLYDKIEPNIVCASYYLRTWESAFLLYNKYFKNNGILYILPYIHEHNDNDHSTSSERMEEYKIYNIKKSLFEFTKFIEYCKKFIKKYNMRLFKKMTFRLPKIIFINKYGKEIDGYKCVNMNYYKKNIYLYNPNFHIFENKILPSFLNSFNSLPHKISIITHGKIIKTDILHFDKKMNDFPESISIYRKIEKGKVDDKYLLINNCDTFMKKYVYKNKDNLIDTRQIKQIFPFSFKSISIFDYLQIPFYKCKVHNIEKNIQQILQKKKYILNNKDKKYLLGFYNNPKMLQYINNFIQLYILFLQKEKK